MTKELGENNLIPHIKLEDVSNFECIKDESYLQKINEILNNLSLENEVWRIIKELSDNLHVDFDVVYISNKGRVLGFIGFEFHWIRDKLFENKGDFFVISIDNVGDLKWYIRPLLFKYFKCKYSVEVDNITVMIESDLDTISNKLQYPKWFVLLILKKKVNFLHKNLKIERIYLI